MIGRPEFVLRLRAPADPSDVDGIRRLRRALKKLWRAYGLKALECRPVEEDSESTVNAGPESENTPQNTAVPTPGARGNGAMLPRMLETGRFRNPVEARRNDR
jgi:hypothetical protein